MTDEMQLMDAVFMHKGVECHFSQSASERIGSDDDKTAFLDNFFEHEPMNAIKWVTLEELEKCQFNDAALPMYSIRNSKGDTLLIWPMLDNANLHLYIESLVDRPELRPELRLD
jgi:hypothetical protein